MKKKDKKQRGNTYLKETQETQEKKDEIPERKTKTEDRKHSKRKRENNNTREVDVEVEVLLSEETHHKVEKVVTHKPSNTTSIKSGFGLKQSKIIQKPTFKSRRKANPRLSQTNKIINYFPNLGTIHGGKGGDESASSCDFNSGVFKSTQPGTRLRPRTYMDNGPGS